MKIKQKCLSLLLALTMVTGTAFSTTAFAADGGAETEPGITVEGLPETATTETKIEEDTSQTPGLISGGSEGFDSEERTPIEVSLTTDSEIQNVRVEVEVTKDGEKTEDGIQLIAQDTNKNWYNIVKAGWGPNNGFVLKEGTATTPVYLVASEAGEYSATIRLMDVSDSSDPKELAETTTDTVTVSEPDGEITNAKALRQAIKEAGDNDTITLGGNFTVSKSIVINRPLTLDGNGHTITASDNIQADAGSKNNHVIAIVNTEDVKIENLDIAGNGKKDNYKDNARSGILVYASTGVNLTDISVSDATCGIILDESTLTLNGNAEFNRNTWGGINITNSEHDLEKELKLSFGEDVSFSGDFGETPQIWADCLQTDAQEALEEAKDYFAAENYGWSAAYTASQVWFTPGEEEPPAVGTGTLQVAKSVIGEKITVSYQDGGETKTATNGEKLTDIPEGTTVTATVDISGIKEHKEYYTIDGTQILRNGLPGDDVAKVDNTRGTFTFEMQVEEEQPITVVSAAVGTKAIDGKFPVKVDKIDGGYLFAYTESDDGDEYTILPIGKEVLVPEDASVSVEFYPDYRQIDSENQEIELKEFTTRVGSETDTDDEEDNVEISAPTVITGKAEYVKDEDKEPGSYWLVSKNVVKRSEDIKDGKVCDLKLRQEKETGGYKDVESPSLTFKIEEGDDGDLFWVDGSSLKAVGELPDREEEYHLTITASVDGEQKASERIGINLSFPAVVYNYYFPTSPSALDWSYWSYPQFKAKHIDSRTPVGKDFVSNNTPVISLYDEDGNTTEKAEWLYYEDKELGKLKEFDIDDFDSLGLTDTDDLWLYAAFKNYTPEAGALENPGDHDNDDHDNDDNDHHKNSGGSGSGSSGRGGHTVIVSGTAPDNKPVVTVGNDPQGKPVVTVGARPLPNAKPLTAAEIAKKAADGTLNAAVNPNGVWDGRTVGAKNIALVIDTKEAALATGGSYRLGVSAFAGPAGSKLRVRASRDGFVTITTNPDGTYTITANRPVSGLYILVEILDANGNVVGHSSMKLDAAAGLASKQVQNKAATIA